jgi:hypothetical protein
MVLPKVSPPNNQETTMTWSMDVYPKGEVEYRLMDW